MGSMFASHASEPSSMSANFGRQFSSFPIPFAADTIKSSYLRMHQRALNSTVSHGDNEPILFPWLIVVLICIAIKISVGGRVWGAV